MRYTLMFEANRTNLKQMKEKRIYFVAYANLATIPTYLELHWLRASSETFGKESISLRRHFCSLLFFAQHSLTELTSFCLYWWQLNTWPTALSYLLKHSSPYPLFDIDICGFKYTHLKVNESLNIEGEERGKVNGVALNGIMLVNQVILRLSSTDCLINLVTKQWLCIDNVRLAFKRLKRKNPMICMYFSEPRFSFLPLFV